MQQNIQTLSEVIRAFEAQRDRERKEVVFRIIYHWYQENIPEAHQTPRTAFLKLNETYGPEQYDQRIDAYIQLILDDIRGLPDGIRLAKRTDYSKLIKTIEAVVQRLDYTIEKLRQHRVVLELIQRTVSEADLADIEQALHTLNPTPAWDSSPYLI